ncbi:S-layer homology domain-containing protein [Lysinibacillus sp. FSL K6-4013]|uniref:S-layer homology domain-containing protein n=1 Tax=Lysinibacillus sp. FSL K6-4013 TaxID=2921504 RepID=UPI00315B21AC
MAKQNKGRKFFAASATAALVASAIVPVASAAQVNDYNKISGYAKEAVQSLVDAGVIQGDTNGNFNPLNTVTRAQAAEIFTKALELEADGDVNFSDVKKGAWYYNSIAAVVANGIFEGVSANEFAPNKSLTRSEAAKVLVDAFGLEGSESLSQFADASQVKPWAKDALETAVANGIFTGSEENGKLNLKPNAAITRQDFAVVFARTLDLAVETVDASIKAINATTVEVTFDEEVDVDNVKAENFKIDGLEVKSAAIKQTNKKVVVLTTAAQTADKEYVLSYKDEEIGKFKGVAAVIPTKIDVTTASLQGVIGNEVTLKAQVTVPEGQDKSGIPVTFNIVNNKTTNEKIEKVAYTNAEGVATYSYTRYYGSEDSVAAYATDKASVVSNAKVYWADKIQLAVSEITTGNDLTNNTKKSYKVKGAKNTTYYVTVKENIGVTPDKVTKLNVQNAGSSLFVVPTELSTGGNNVVATVVTDADGEATFTVYGENLTATPIVYDAKTVSGNLNSAGTLVDDEYSKTALQAEAPAVKYSKIDALKLSVVAEGVAEAAQYDTTPGAYNQNSVGGRTYTVTVTDKDGKLAPAGSTAYVTFEENNFADSVYFSTGKNNFQKVTKNAVFAITVGKEGKATFRVAGHGSTAFVKPTVFLNTAGSTSTPALDKTDVQTVADVTYFKSAVVKNAVLKVTDANGNTITSTTVGTDAYIKYQSVDQNGFAYKPTVSNYQLAFDVTSTFGNTIVKDENGTVLNAHHNQGNTKTYQVFSNSVGEAVIRVSTTSADTVKVNVTGANGILPTQDATVSFTTASTADVATGEVISINKPDQKFVIQNATGASYTLSYDEDDVAQYQIAGVRVEYDVFEAALTTTDSVSATKTADGKYILNITNDRVAGPVTINSQTAFNQALANGETSFNLNITSGGLTINTIATTTLNLTGSVVGDVTVNAPNAHINNTATITGNVNIIDVAGSSFVNAGSITGNVVISDSNAKFDTTTGTFAGKIIINGTGSQTITLLGTANNNIVVGANVTQLTLTSPNANNTISAESATTVVSNNGTTFTPGVVGGKGTTGVIELDAADYVVGAKALVTLTDADLDTNPAVQDKVKVKLTYGTATATELELTETSANSGEFVAYVAADKAGSLKVSYTDVKTASGTVEEKLATAVVYATDAEQAKPVVEKFKLDHKVILAKTVETVAITDKAAVTAAKTDLDKLSAAAKAQLTKEATLLTDLATKIADLEATPE